MKTDFAPPKDVGIKGIELYFPKCYIDQEAFAKVGHFVENWFDC